MLLDDMLELSVQVSCCLQDEKRLSSFCFPPVSFLTPTIYSCFRFICLHVLSSPLCLSVSLCILSALLSSQKDYLSLTGSLGRAELARGNFDLLFESASVEQSFGRLPKGLHCRPKPLPIPPFRQFADGV